MALYFLDTSALVKRYITEPGSTWVRTLCTSHTIAVSALALAEINSVFARRSREGTLSANDRNAMLHLFQIHVLQYSLVDLDRPVLGAAGALLLQAPATTTLRSLDAIQLACAQAFGANASALGFGSLTVVAADTRLLAAAQWAGIATDDPNN
jgi:predicted nucleic acid-binding protein